jgi:hypothetical protein
MGAADRRCEFHSRPLLAGHEQGVVDFKLDSYAPKVAPPQASPSESEPRGKPASALEILLDSVEARIRPR